MGSDSLHIPCKRYGRKTPLKIFLKNAEKIPRQDHPMSYAVAEFKQNQ